MNQQTLFKKEPKKNCIKCGAPTTWIKTVKGKWMLCERDGIVTEGGETIITIDGHTKKNCAPGNYGHVPHWQNCPYAEDFRKGSK